MAEIMKHGHISLSLINFNLIAADIMLNMQTDLKLIIVSTVNIVLNKENFVLLC